MNDIVVVDTNIFISALTSRNDDILRILSRPETSFVSTNYVVVELFKHAPRIQRKSHLSPEKLLEVLSILIGQVRLLDDGLISIGSWIEARRHYLCCSHIGTRRVSVDTKPTISVASH